MSNNKMIIKIDAQVLNGMFEYAHAAKNIHGSEIAGFAHYDPTKGGIYKLAPLQSQTVSGAEAETFPSGIVNDLKYDISDMSVQWHSHVMMNVFLSGTDEANIRETLKQQSMLISIVVNCKGEYKCVLDVASMKVGKALIKLDNALRFDVELQPYYDDNSYASNEVKAKCKKPVIKHVDPYRDYHHALSYTRSEQFRRPPIAIDDDYYDYGYAPSKPAPEPPPLLPLFDKIPDAFIEKVADKAAQLSKENNDITFQRNMLKDDNSLLVATNANDYYVVDVDGEEVNGVEGTWNGFLLKIGANIAKYGV